MLCWEKWSQNFPIGHLPMGGEAPVRIFRPFFANCIFGQSKEPTSSKMLTFWTFLGCWGSPTYFIVSAIKCHYNQCFWHFKKLGRLAGIGGKGVGGGANLGNARKKAFFFGEPSLTMMKRSMEKQENMGGPDLLGTPVWHTEDITQERRQASAPNHIYG